MELNGLDVVVVVHYSVDIDLTFDIHYRCNQHCHLDFHLDNCYHHGYLRNRTELIRLKKIIVLFYLDNLDLVRHGYYFHDIDVGQHCMNCHNELHHLNLKNKNNL